MDIVKWTGSFSITTLPYSHSLCGTISEIKTFQGDEITAMSTPVFEADDTLFGKVETDDESYASLPQPQEYGYRAELLDYPVTTYSTATSATATGDITFTNTCSTGTPSAETQNDATDAFSGNVPAWTFVAFTPTPDYCTVTYTCTSVVDSDGNSYDCSNFINDSGDTP